eukprot:1161574-Pelagomonas_calceolata.AAC.2
MSECLLQRSTVGCPRALQRQSHFLEPLTCEGGRSAFVCCLPGKYDVGSAVAGPVQSVLACTQRTHATSRRMRVLAFTQTTHASSRQRMCPTALKQAHTVICNSAAILFRSKLGPTPSQNAVDAVTVDALTVDVPGVKGTLKLCLSNFQAQSTH